MSDHTHYHHGDPATDTEAATDPVCGMQVEIREASRILERYVLALLRHLQAHVRRRFAFQRSGDVAKQAPAARAYTVWTCPMHPEIVRDQPGSCPICGMALEPVVPPSDEPSEELVDFACRM